MKKIKWFKLFIILLITQLIGILGGLLAGNMKQIYESFIKPPLSPPGWLFGVVWPLLYLLMGIAAYMIYEEIQSSKRKKAINLYWIQLVINFMWTIVFFRFQVYWLSVTIIFLLDILVIITAISFSRIKKEAGYLMIPYLIWIVFATYLNIGIALLN